MLKALASYGLAKLLGGGIFLAIVIYLLLSVLGRWRRMTIDERAQLVEDIRVAGTKRREIAERAQLDKEFDIAAAWEDLAGLDASIEKRVGDSNLTR